VGKPENSIFKSIKSDLDMWMTEGVVIHYDDIRRLNLKCIRGQYFSHKPKGTPDIVIYIKNQYSCWIYFVEIKSKNDSIRSSQLIFGAKFSELQNVIYEAVNSASQVNNTIETITMHFDKKIKEMEI